MGVTIFSKNYSIDIGYGGFARLRRTVAEQCPEEIRKHYLQLPDASFSTPKQQKEYDDRTEELYKRYNSKYGKVINFLYAPDIEKTLGYDTAEQILGVVDGYEDSSVYGFMGERIVMFSDFVRILRDSASTKSDFGWY